METVHCFTELASKSAGLIRHGHQRRHSVEFRISQRNRTWCKTQFRIHLVILQSSFPHELVCDRLLLKQSDRSWFSSRSLYIVDEKDKEIHQLFAIEYQYSTMKRCQSVGRINGL